MIIKKLINKFNNNKDLLLLLLNLMNINQLESNFSFSENEDDILELWQNENIYQKLINKNKNGINFDFVDGPPFVSSDKLHWGHLLVSSCKSIITFFEWMKGKNINNKIGYDCHGLPIEMKVNAILGVDTKKSVEELGIDRYNNKCKEVINSYSGAWKPVFNKLGRWVDFDNEYKTLDTNFMESVWWVFNELWKKDLVYRGYRVMPFSTGCCTPLSNFEASQDYRDKLDPSIYIKFKLKDQDKYIIAWTTTPWTLPSNLALCVNKDLTYVEIIDLTSNDIYILAKNTLKNLYTVPKKAKNYKKPYNIIKEFNGIELVGLEYDPIFDYFNFNKRSFKIICDDYVKSDSGTGIVHQAPAHGEDDLRVCLYYNVLKIDEVGNFCPVDDCGLYTDVIYDYKNMYVLDANTLIIKRLKESKIMIKKEMYRHSYPHCWRTGTPLIYKAVDSFFIKVTAIKDDLIANNNKINWIPEHIGNKRFKNWLSNTKDWCVSRSRFFGTPIPVWCNENSEEMICVGSIDELKELAEVDEDITDIHREFIDHLTIKSKKTGNTLYRVPYILDCWFESGSVPLAQLHYPFKNKNFFDNKDYLCEFICEGVDQTRGWFYTLNVLSTALFNKPAFKNVICTGLILAKDGKKFSKRDNNFTSPLEVFNKFGADACRLYLSSSPASRAEAFKFLETDIKQVLSKIYQFTNAFKFFIEHYTKFTKDGNDFNLNAFTNSNNIMDKWILSYVGTTVKKITVNLDNMILFKTLDVFYNYVENVTNWYVKFNRNRIKGRYTTKQDQSIALSTLYRILITSTKLFAPFMPFLMEKLYQNIKIISDEKKDSVILCNYPDSHNFTTDDIVEKKMHMLQQVCNSIRSIRSKSENSKSAKIPLKRVVISNDDKEYLDNIKELEHYLREEINALNIDYSVLGDQVRYKIIPNDRNIGQEFRSRSNMIKKKLSNIHDIKDLIEFDDIVLKRHHHYDIGVELGYDMFRKEDTHIINDETLIRVDLEIDQQVKEVYRMRLFVVSVQAMRKKTKLRPWNKIKIYYDTDHKNMLDVLEKYNDKITTDLIYNIYPDSEREDSDNIIIQEDHVLDDIHISIIITKD